MRVARLAFIALAIVLFAIPATTLADTYSFYDLGSADTGRDIVGITPSGSVVISWLGAYDMVYETWTDGVLVNRSATDPGLAYDNGSTCTPSVSPAIGSENVSYAACNGVHEVFGTGHWAPASYANSIFDGPNPSNFVAKHETLEPFRLNASGDFVFVADQYAYPSDGEIFEYVDLSTAPVPEPSSFLLFGVGVLVMAWMVRRNGSFALSAH